MKTPPQLVIITTIAALAKSVSASEVAALPNPLDFPGQGPVGPLPGGPGTPPLLPPVITTTTVVDTTPAWNGTAAVSSFGVPDTATYGQTITVPLADTYLDSFSFYMNLPATTSFRSYVYAWNGTSATGSALYTSPITATVGSSSFEQIQFNTGGLSLTPGALYVLFASTSAVPGSSGTGPWGQPNSTNPYSGGGFVFLNNGTNTSQWTSSPWTQNFLGTGGDLAFKATFSNTGTSVPEPSSSAVIALLASTTLFRRRRR